MTIPAPPPYGASSTWRWRPGAWSRSSPKVDQAAVDAEPHPQLATSPSGDAVVETYTVLFNRDGAPERGIIIGRFPSGDRFIANTPPDARLLDSMTKHEMVAAKGRVTASDSGANTFVPA